MSPKDPIETMVEEFVSRWRGIRASELSSTVHVRWALAAGGRLGVGNDPRYSKTRCFEPFPFPLVASEPGERVAVAERVRELAERLDHHRKHQQSVREGLALTAIYNVLQQLRDGETLSSKERTAHDQGLVSVLREIHDDLDAAVLEAYGWSDLLPVLRVAHGNDAPSAGQSQDDAKRAFDEAILERLVALNAERAAEEARGLVRWLRPEFQNPAGAKPTQPELVGDEDEEEADALAVVIAPTKPKPWPKDPVEQVRAVADLLAASSVSLGEQEIAARFTARGPWKRRLPQLLATLVAVGRAREENGRFSRVEN